MSLGYRAKWDGAVSTFQISVYCWICVGMLSGAVQKRRRRTSDVDAPIEELSICFYFGHEVAVIGARGVGRGQPQCPRHSGRQPQHALQGRPECQTGRV